MSDDPIPSREGHAAAPNPAFVTLIAGAAALGGFLFGFDTAVINGAVRALEHEFAATSWQLGLSVSVALVGSAIGAVTGFVRDRLRDAQREAGQEVQDSETVVEWNYHIQLTPWLYLRPDMQYVIKPNGFSSIDDAFVIGFEFGARF